MTETAPKPMPIQYYRKLPVVIAAIQWDGTLAGMRGIEKAFPQASTHGKPAGTPAVGWRKNK